MNIFLNSPRKQIFSLFLQENVPWAFITSTSEELLMSTYYRCFHREIRISIIAFDKALFSTKKHLYFFLFLNENTCGYSLDAPN